VTIGWASDVVTEVKTCAFTVKYHSEMQINSDKAVRINENPKDRYSCLKRPPRYLTPTKPMGF
jgi:hypothetical protein